MGRRPQLTSLYLPRVGKPIANPPTLAASYMVEGDLVRAGATIAELESDGAALEVYAPVTGTLTRVAAVADGNEVDLAQPLAHIRLDLGDGPLAAGWRAAARLLVPGMAIALCLPAILLPVPWFVLVALLAGLDRGDEEQRGRSDGSGRGPFGSLAVAGAQMIAVTLRGIFSVGPLLRVLFKALALAVLAILLAALVGACAWLLSHGWEGIGSAVRLAVLSYAGALLSFLFCLSLVVSRLRKGTRATDLRERWLTGSLLSGSGLTASLIAALLVLFTIASPQSVWWPNADFQDAIASLPSAMRSSINQQIRSFSRHEAGAVTTCIHRHHRFGKWQVERAHLGPDGTPRILVASAGGRGPLRSLPSLVVALRNRLAPIRGLVSVRYRRHSRSLRLSTGALHSPLVNMREVIARGELVPRAAAKRLSRHYARARPQTESALQCSSPLW